MTKETRIYNEKMTVSSINGIWKTGQLHAKSETRLTYIHHVQK